ncbi:rni-like superfamily protein [Anaeramoeba ignava]|uniref:Rni-like superfamily protein n=1 Tax=Anaeramoeba ignava TaxID=1746090 RepID=A0A9Q0LVA0_ANAIG|nr:rni-like superfamily protein [Anaeramoeba ignava]
MGSKFSINKIKNKKAQNLFIKFRKQFPEEEFISTDEKKKHYGVIEIIYRECQRKKKDLNKFLLKLDNSRLGIKGLEALCTSLYEDDCVTQLSLRKSEINQQGARIISELLKKNQTITDIDLSSNPVGTAGVRFLVDAIISIESEKQNLKALYLNNIELKEEGAIIVSYLLENNQKLEILEIGANDITSRGLGYIADALKGNTRLVSLNLESNPKLTSEDVEEVTKIVTRNAIINEVIEGLLNNACQRQFKTRMIVFDKSIRGLAMLEGKKNQMNQARGTPLYQVFQQSITKSKQDVPKVEKIENFSMRFVSCWYR